MADVEIDTNVKDFTNRNNFGVIVCTSGTRPTAVDGKAIYETDTNKLLIYNGASWIEISSGSGVTDHGALTGLTDDDHTQYLLVDGSREMSGGLDMGGNSITDINEIWFNTSDPGIKFDTGDFIWFDTSENRIYFEIASANICYVRSTGIHPVTDSTYYLGSGSAYWSGLYADDVVVEAGTYITGDGAGNMELHVATGKTVKIVVG